MALQVKLNILVGTMTGTAEIVAEDVRDALESDGFEGVEILPMDDLDSSIFEREGVFLICTSTYGQGEVPDNALAFYEGVQSAAPDLSKVRYGVIGLGDSTYVDTYNSGGELFDALLTKLGAVRVGERMTHDASGDRMPEEEAVEWARDWAVHLAPALDAA